MIGFLGINMCDNNCAPLESKEIYDYNIDKIIKFLYKKLTIKKKYYSFEIKDILKKKYKYNTATVNEIYNILRYGLKEHRLFSEDNILIKGEINAQ